MPPGPPPTLQAPPIPASPTPHFLSSAPPHVSPCNAAAPRRSPWSSQAPTVSACEALGSDLHLRHRSLASSEQTARLHADCASGCDCCAERRLVPRHSSQHTRCEHLSNLMLHPCVLWARPTRSARYATLAAAAACWTSPVAGLLLLGYPLIELPGGLRVTAGRH